MRLVVKAVESVERDVIDFEGWLVCKRTWERGREAYIMHCCKISFELCPL